MIKQYIPNIISSLRLIAAFVAIYGFAIAHSGLLIALIFFGGIADWADGFLARKWKCESRLGALLDPISDKCMLLFYLVGLYCIWGIGFWIMLLAIIRDCAIVIGFLCFKDRLKKPKVLFISKLNTTVVGVYILISLIALYFPGIYELYLCQKIFSWLSVVLLVWSFWAYGTLLYRHLK